jgi:hypothetical protein
MIVDDQRRVSPDADGRWSARTNASSLELRSAFG